MNGMRPVSEGLRGTPFLTTWNTFFPRRARRATQNFFFLRATKNFHEGPLRATRNFLFSTKGHKGPRRTSFFSTKDTKGHEELPFFPRRTRRATKNFLFPRRTRRATKNTYLIFWGVALDVGIGIAVGDVTGVEGDLTRPIFAAMMERGDYEVSSAESRSDGVDGLPVLRAWRLRG